MRSMEARIFVESALVVLFVGLVSAQAPQQSPAGSEQQVREAARQMLEAAQQKDRDEFGRLVSDNAAWVDRTGVVMTKSELLEFSGPTPRAVDVEKVNVRANSALLTGIAHLPDGRDARFLQEWVNEAGHWKLIGHQATIVQTSPALAAVGTSGKKAAATERISTWRSIAPTLRSKDEKDVWKTEMALQGAYLRGDSAAYSRLTANDYVRVKSDGSQASKEEFLQEVKQNAGRQGGDLKSNDVQIIVDGDSAREIMTIWGTEPGGSPIDLMRLTRYFKKSGGHWQQVATAVTPIPEK